MKYKVIYPFIENGKKYWSGDTYANDDKKRIKALASTDNKIGKVLIEKIDDTPKEKAEVEVLQAYLPARLSAEEVQAAVQAGSDALAESTEQVVVSGERKLLDVPAFGNDMGSLRKLFDVFEQKTELMRLLDVSSRAEGVRIYIGGESHVVPFEELSVVTAPYEVDGRVVGTLGVIGPTRMAYERVIPIVDITAKLLSSALTYQANS